MLSELLFHFEHDELDGDLLVVWGARYVAEITGRDRKFRYERRFITTRQPWPESLDEVVRHGPFLQPFRIVLQDCIGMPIFLDVAQEKPIRSYWKVNKRSIWAVLPVSEKEMRRVLAEGRGVKPSTQLNEATPRGRRFFLPARD